MASNKRLALVTGAAQGLGRAIAERLARDDIAVVIADIQEQAARDTARELADCGIEAIAMTVNVASESSVSNLYRDIDKRFGRLDILVNNAGVLGLDQAGNRPRVEDMSLELWQQTLDVNLTGTFLASRGAIPLMRRGRWGRIVNIASRAARMRTGIGNS
ncbi:MAG TPA: SDR family NAD(P)-dependent oxidoreductase, partial [Casimicrobiaceae bacterium]|nr:SDR family NAD(P)-dependent oxidoreductase [Casimicrobiaceae bacterium]